MILADTSIWVHHFRRSNPILATSLTTGQVAAHTFVIGELACGNLPKRRTTLRDLQSLPNAPKCLDKEVLKLIDSKPLFGRGIGYIDAHLLASSLISGYPLWTRDKRLAELAKELGCSFT